MQNSFNINLLMALQSSLTPTNNYQPPFIDIAGSEQKFEAILNEKINEITNQKNLNNYDKVGENSVSQQDKNVGLNSESRRFNQNESDGRINRDFQDNSNKENVERAIKKDVLNPEEVKRESKISETEDGNNLKIKERKSLIDDLSLLLDNLNLLLDLIKGASLDKKQTNELKSILSELRNILDFKSNQAANAKNNDIAAIDAVLIKKLLERLKSLVDTANERAGIRNHILGRNQLNEKDLTDSKSETLEIANLKKQISKLADEVRQHLTNKKAEITSANSEDSFVEGKNINQKILVGNHAVEKNEKALGKENNTGFNFSFSNKESETNVAQQQKVKASLAERKGAFDEQMNSILQNARITVRDGKNGSFSIRLYPESLGQVNVNLNLEKGVIAGKFLVDSLDAKEALLENMSAVKENLLENGISVGEFQVNVRGENKSFSETSEEIPLYDPSRIFPGFAGIEYESNSIYFHNGEIDLII